jgi:hypothetical protein
MARRLRFTLGAGGRNSVAKPTSLRSLCFQRQLLDYLSCHRKPVQVNGFRNKTGSLKRGNAVFIFRRHRGTQSGDKKIDKLQYLPRPGAFHWNGA